MLFSPLRHFPLRQKPTPGRESAGSNSSRSAAESVSPYPIVGRQANATAARAQVRGYVASRASRIGGRHRYALTSISIV
jgi:hypothetical protein